MDSRDLFKLLHARKNLPAKAWEKLKCFLGDNLDIFEWKHKDMVGVNLKFSCHYLKIDPKATPHRQKRRALNPERYEH